MSTTEDIEIINELIKLLQLSNNSIISNNQIQILLSLSCSDIVNLYKKYKSLSNDVLLSDDIIRLAVQNNGLILQYISYNKLTEEICELAVQNNGFAIQYIPDNKITDEIIKLAVENNPYIIGYIHEDKKTIEIIKQAVQIDGNTLQFISNDKLTEEICKIAVQLHYPVFRYKPGNFQLYFIFCAIGGS
jgi:hypothetical protein